MNNLVAHKVGPGWIVADTAGIIAVGTDEAEILDLLEEAYGPSARLIESDPQTFLSTLQVGQANQLKQTADTVTQIAQDFERSKGRLVEASVKLAKVELQAESQERRYEADKLLAGKERRRSELQTAFLAEGFKTFEVAALIEEQLRKEFDNE